MNENSFVSISQVQKNTDRKQKVKDWYFAYGANMNLEQIRARCSRPVPVTVARLAEHRLGFYGHSETWDGALETVEPTPGDEVWGVIFELNGRDWERLDEWQGARMDGGGMYFHFPVTVTDRHGETHNVRLYKKTCRALRASRVVSISNIFSPARPIMDCPRTTSNR